MTTTLSGHPQEQIAAPTTKNTFKKNQPTLKDGRINFRATEKLISILADLKDSKNMNMSQSIRKGVSLLHIAMQEQDKGRKLAFIDEQGKVVAEVHTL